MIISYNSWSQDIDAAIQLSRSEQYDKAEIALKELIQKEPANSKNYFYLGENYLLDYFSDTISNSLAVAAKLAKETYEKGVSANPNDPLNYVGLAKVAYYLNDDKTAEEMRAKAKSFLLPYKNIRKIVPPAKEYAFTLAKIAESYIRDGKVDTSVALPLIRQAIKIDNKNRDIYLIAGDIYILVNDGSNAIMNYNQAQFADPTSPTANMKIGSIYVKGRNLQNAIPYFEEAIKLNPNYAPAYRELGQLYSRAGRFEQSNTNFKKYLEMTKGNIPARIRYVQALYLAREYDEVIKNVEEIFKVDQSRTYMNRIAAFSAFEKDNPDYDQALNYMETLFKTVAPERIIKKDYHYMAQILLKKNQNYTKTVDESNRLKTQLAREQSRYANASAASKAALKPNLDTLTAKVSRLDKQIAAADSEIDRAFGEYNKELNFVADAPPDKNLLNEIANNYYLFRRYEKAAETWEKMIPLGKDNVNDLMQIGRAYSLGENYKKADSMFNEIVKKYPDHIDAYINIARTYSRMDPDYKTGLAKPKFETFIVKAAPDSLKYESQLMEAFQYLSYFHMINNNFSTSRNYYNRMINLNPQNKDNKVKGYMGLGSIEMELARNEKTIEGKLAILGRAAEAYNNVLAIDPGNAAAKSTAKYVQDYIASVKKGINPNEIKGIIKDTSGQPVPYASVRVKDTAAENLANAKGEYKFEIPQGSEVLIISAKGYKTKEVEITRSRIYNVVLEK
jgi:tetratricopeptide (TPR) repeat protein